MQVLYSLSQSSKQFLSFQAETIQELKEAKSKGEAIDLAGDGKFDSPGWSARFCTYVIQSLKNNKIIAVWVANKSMVASSSKMETLAAKSLLLNLVSEHELIIDSFTTDRSSDMRTLMR